MKQTYSPKDVAEAIGVSESSLKRWADSGRLDVVRTVGGHRRIAFHEVIRFARAEQLRIVRPDVLGLPELAKAEPLREGDPAGTLQTLLTEGRAEETRALLMDEYLGGRSVASICDGPVRTVMAHIGELWRCEGSRGIYLEHRATDTLIQAMTALRALVGKPPAARPDRKPGDPPAAPIALGGAPGGDSHLLPSLAIALTLCEAGFHEINLGPHTPLDALLAAADQYRPRLLWLSCSLPDARPRDGELKPVFDWIADHQAALVVGGRGFAEQPPKPHPRVRLCDSMSELAAFVEGLTLNAG